MAGRWSARMEFRLLTAKTVSADDRSVQSKVMIKCIHALDRSEMVLIAQLEAFVTLAHQHRMRIAGERLHLSQPALSARIAGLETELGARLFERGREGMVLTAAGRAFLVHAERALDAVESGTRIVRDVEDGQDGLLVVGAAPAVSAYVVPELIARLRRFYPGVRVSVRTGHSEEIVELVATGDAQIGLVRELRDERLRSELLYEEELALVARPDHPFVSEGRIPLSRLRDATLILFDRASTYYDLTHALFRDAGVSPYSVIEADNIETAKRMVTRGIGVALLPTTATAEAIDSHELAAIDLPEARAIRRRVIALERPGQREWAPMTTLWTLLRTIPSFIPGAAAVADGGQHAAPSPDTTQPGTRSREGASSPSSRHRSRTTAPSGGS
jgi:DNA-binding transcriptional LysR family regulator